MAETILIVDDEESVRRTMHDWLATSNTGCEVHAVASAEAALLFASQKPIDLAILDWNLGTGSDGLQLLEDLVEFHPDIVAILVTGFAHQATPLDALRMGVRDYLDKNQDLNRETFLDAVRKQLDRIVPAKRQRQFSNSLLAFREAVEKVLPLVQSAAALNDPVPLPDAIRSLFRFLLRTTQATSGVLIVRHVGPDGDETIRAYDADGTPLDAPTVPFARSLAASVLSMQEPCVLNRKDLTGAEYCRISAVRAGLHASSGGADGRGGRHARRSRAIRQADGQTVQRRRSPTAFRRLRLRRGVAAAGARGTADPADSLRRGRDGSAGERFDRRVVAIAFQFSVGVAAADRGAGSPEAGPRRDGQPPDGSGFLHPAGRSGPRAGRAARARGSWALHRHGGRPQEIAGRSDGRLMPMSESHTVFDELFALLTPERLLRDPRATGEGVTSDVIDSGIERAVLENKFPAAYPIEGGGLSRRSCRSHCPGRASNRRRTAPPSPTSC